MPFVLSNKAKSDRVSKVNEAYLIRTGALILIFHIITYDIMANNNSNHEIIELLILGQHLDVAYDEISSVYFLFDGYCFENHLVCC